MAWTSSSQSFVVICKAEPAVQTADEEVGRAQGEDGKASLPGFSGVSRGTAEQDD